METQKKQKRVAQGTPLVVVVVLIAVTKVVVEYLEMQKLQLKDEV